MATLFVDKVDPQSGTSLEIGSSGDTITIPSGATITNSGTATGFGATNKPALDGEVASTQTIARNSYVKVTGMTNDEVDTNTAFDGTTFTVPSGEGGTYFLYASIQADFEVAGDDGELARCYLYKNGSELKVAQFKVEGTGGNIRYIAASVSLTATLSASDTIELYTLLNDFSGNDARVLSNATSIGGYKLF